MREDQFLAGVLQRLPLLCGFGMPSQDSYQRVQPMCVGAWVAYGTGNRDTPVRKIRNGHYEFRAIDSTANMYLVLAAYIAAGLLGLQERQDLCWNDCQVAVSTLDNQAREMLGITTEMPKSLAESLAILDDGWMGLDQLLSIEFLDRYSAVKKAEQMTLSRMVEKDRKELYLTNF